MRKQRDHYPKFHQENHQLPFQGRLRHGSPCRRHGLQLHRHQSHLHHPRRSGPHLCPRPGPILLPDLRRVLRLARRQLLQRDLLERVRQLFVPGHFTNRGLLFVAFVVCPVGSAAVALFAVSRKVFRNAWDSFVFEVRIIWFERPACQK